jgi:anti-anti-sigma factor
MALQTTVEQVDGPEPITVLTLDGELDGTAFEGVIDTIRGMYDAGTRVLVLDLTRLWFISSSGLVAIHAAMRLMRGEAAPDTEQGWVALRAVQQEADAGQVSTALRLVGVQAAIQKVLDRTGLGPLIPTYRDRAAALAGG